MGRKRSDTPTISFVRGTVRARWTSDSGRHAVTLGRASDPATWKANYARLLERLAADPNAPGRLAAGDYLVAELARDYLASTAIPASDRPNVRRALSVLSASHAATPAAEYLPEKHKSKAKGKPRWVPLGPQARAVVRPYLDRGPDLPCFSPQEGAAAGIAARAARRVGGEKP